MTALTTGKTNNIVRIISYIIVCAICLLFILTLAKRISDSGDMVVSSRDVGNAVTANYIDGGLNSDKTRIETSGGIFLVYGSVAIMKGERFIFEERQNGDNKLCRTGTKDCYAILK